MKKLLTLCFLVLTLGTTLQAQHQSPAELAGRQPAKKPITRWNEIGPYLRIDSVSKGRYTLVFINRDSTFLARGRQTQAEMTAAFFKVYPKQARRFNKKTTRRVTFIVDPDYEGVAAASGGIIRYSPHWMLKNPGDIDVVTHEVFHLVQSYPHRAGPGWLVEGITDYVRYRYGLNHAAANWALPDFQPKHHYTNSYRITGRFLAWLEKHENKKIVDKLDAALRSKNYSAQTWVQLTGKTLDELWQAYSRNPVL
ncbi:MAG: basic secretory protein-like protein [Adhaeribacter sp.]